MPGCFAGIYLNIHAVGFSVPILESKLPRRISLSVGGEGTGKSEGFNILQEREQHTALWKLLEDALHDRILFGQRIQIFQLMNSQFAIKSPTFRLTVPLEREANTRL